MSKQKLFIDFDGTLVNCRKTICKVYNDKYSLHKGYTYADWTKNSIWDFSDVCTLATEADIDSMFGSTWFWDELELFPNVEYVLKELSLQYDIYIVSVGTSDNISEKALWIKEHLPVEHVILLSDSSRDIKSIVDMSGGIFIDDALHNLDCSNADKKYVFGETLDYNRTDKYARLLDWMEVGHELVW